MSMSPMNALGSIPLARIRHRTRRPTNISVSSSVESDLFSFATRSRGHASPDVCDDDNINPLEREEQEWSSIRRNLPPQITGPYIRVISVGGIVGTGLFLGIAQSLRDGGPIGMVLGYFITGTIVYAVVVSLAEMVAYQPNAGGPVGLADIYVDRALGFAMGWNAWYHWTITLPAELSAAAVISKFFMQGLGDKLQENITYGVTSAMLFLAILINMLGRYGQFETVFSSLKICAIITLIIIGLVIISLRIDTQSITSNITQLNSTEPLECVSQIFPGPPDKKVAIGFNYLRCPGPFVQYRGIQGTKGKILGLWSVMMQAIFSYAGSEVPGIAGAEVENPRINIPRAVRNIWTRIFLFYVLSVFVAGLVAPSTHPNIRQVTPQDGATYLLSSPFVIGMKTAGIRYLPNLACAIFLMSAWSAATSDVYVSSRYFFFLTRRGHAPAFLGALVSIKDVKNWLTPRERTVSSRLAHRADDKRLVVPVFGVLIAAMVGCLAYLPAVSGTAEQYPGIQLAIKSYFSSRDAFLVRWHAGTSHAEASESDFQDKYPELCQNTKKHRSRFQPYLAWYAITLCGLILLLHGWVVFNIEGVSKIAQGPDDPPIEPDPVLGSFVVIFVTSYLPVPVFLLFIFGYKLIHQTNFVQLHEMDFRHRNTSPIIAEPAPSTFLGKVLNFVF